MKIWTSDPTGERAGDPASDPTVEMVVRRVAAAHREQRGALLPILHALQAELGYVPKGPSRCSLTSSTSRGPMCMEW